MNPSRKRPMVFAVRDFPPGCGTQSNVSRFHLPEKPLKNPRNSLQNPNQRSDHASKPNGASSLRREAETELRNPNAPKPNGASSLRREAETESRNPNAPKPDGASSLRREAETELRNPNRRTDRAAGTSSQRRESEIRRSSDSDPAPRERVRDVLRLFKQVFKQLDREKAARRSDDLFESTKRIDLRTQAEIEKKGKQVNSEQRIGTVPGIQVGDEFQYKSELRVVGLHFKTMSGIDYMTIGEVKYATCIVSSDSYDYGDRFESDVLVYTGEGGNVINKGKEIEDQKLVKGNLALVNSMRERKEVRVIRGEDRLDKKGKRYIYDGLYLVQEYWVEKGVRGKNVFKFKLCRIPGQPPLTWKKQYY